MKYVIVSEEDIGLFTSKVNEYRENGYEAFEFYYDNARYIQRLEKKQVIVDKVVLYSNTIESVEKLVKEHLKLGYTLQEPMLIVKDYITQPMVKYND